MSLAPEPALAGKRSGPVKAPAPRPPAPIDVDSTLPSVADVAMIDTPLDGTFVAKTDPDATFASGAEEPAERDIDQTAAQPSGDPDATFASQPKTEADGDETEVDRTGDYSPAPAPKKKSTAKAAADPDMPAELGGYEILKQLGKGGMGAVYLARQMSLDRAVALKVMNEQWANDPVFIARFVREAYAAAQLTHHNVVQIYDIGPYLVFVGAIAPEEARQLAVQYFGAWQKGVVPKPVYKTPQASAKTFIALVDRPSSVQSNINFICPVELKPGAPDAIPASVMDNLLGGGSSGRLFQNLREKYGFTYGAYSSLNADRLIGKFEANASVRNEKTDSAIGQFLYEFNKMRTESFTETEVNNMKSYLSGGFARSLENPGTIAQFALNIARYHLPADYYQNYLRNLSNVNTDVVAEMAKKYIMPGRMVIVIVGNAKQIAPGLEKYGEVKYFDVYGNEVAAPVVKKVDASVTPESIIQKAANATGSAEAMAAITDIDMNGEASLMGQSFSVNQKYVLPGTYLSAMSMKGMVLQSKMLKDGKYTMSMQGQSQEGDEQDKEEIDEDAAFFTDAYMLKKGGYKFEMGTIEKVEGKDAYAVNIKTPTGREYTNYYDVANGLKVKSSTVEDAGPAGKVTVQVYFGEYKTFNGIQVPSKVLIDQGSLKIEMNFKDIKVNGGLKADDIK